jgi:hypothetical protein
MGAHLQSGMRRLWFLAVLLCLWPFAAQAITRTPFSLAPEPPQKPPLSLRLERGVPRQDSPPLLVVVRVWPDGRIGLFCGGDPINSFDSNGRFGKAMYQNVGNAVTGTASLLWNILSAASLADDPNAAIDAQSSTQGLNNTVAGLEYLSGQALQGNFGTVGTTLTGGPNQSGAYRAGYALTSIGLLFSGGEFGEAGEVGEASETAEVAETGSQAAQQTTVAADQASGNAGLLTAPPQQGLLTAPPQPVALLPENAASLTPNVSQLPTTLYHYTSAENVESIMQNGLGGEGQQVFTTPAGNLSPVQAQIDLALTPNRGYPSALIEIDTAMLQNLGINPIAGPQSVLSTVNAAGGGTEIIFGQPIPPSALRVVPIRSP